MFRVLPDNFFIPLSSPNKTVYWDCICKLFSVMEHQLSFGVERDVLADELEYYFDQTGAAEVVEEDFAGSDSRGKANGILRRLEYYGWIEVEEGRQMEYQGYIYTIYSLVRGGWENPGVVLLQILENTDFLITGLKNLNSSIKRYIDELTRYSNVAEIMDALFNDYIANVVDKAYHRLLTSDNVSKFRPEIIERLESKSRSKAYIEKAAAELADLQETDIDTARENVYRYLHEIIEAFRNMDEILNEINQKNTQYLKAAINRAKFRLAGHEDVRGQIKEILIGINERINQEQLELGGIYELEFLEGLIRIYSSGVLDGSSLYSPVEGKKEFTPREIRDWEPNLTLRQEKLRKLTEKMERVLSVEKIEKYVDNCLGDRKEMRAVQFPLRDTEDFIKIIYIRLYGQRKNMKYGVEPLEEKEVNGYRFKDFRIWRK